MPCHLPLRGCFNGVRRVVAGCHTLTLRKTARPIHAMKKRIFVGFPTTGGSNCEHTTVSLFNMAVSLAKADLDPIIGYTNNTAIPEARDLLVDKFLKSDASHLLFVDSDMAFQPDICERLLAHNQEMVGTIYPRRHFRGAVMKKWVDEGKSFEAALAAMLSFIIENPKLPEDNSPLMQCDSIGTGFVLMARSVFDQMREKLQLRRYQYRDIGPTTDLHSYFERMIEGDILLSEDISFYRRWTRDLGKPLYADPNAKVLHIGPFPYGMEFAKAQMLMQRG